MRKKLRRLLTVLLTLSVCLSTMNMDVYAIEEADEMQPEQNGNDEQIIKDEIDTDNDTITKNADDRNDNTTESVYRGENFEVKFMLTDYWSDGYNAKIMIENTGKPLLRTGLWNLIIMELFQIYGMQQ